MSKATKPVAKSTSETQAKAPKAEPKTREKADLKPRSIRILQALAKAKGGLTSQGIAEAAPCDIAFVGDHIGRVDPEVRAAREKKIGYISMLTRKYVSMKLRHLDGGITERIYEITAAGRKALEKALKAEQAK